MLRHSRADSGRPHSVEVSGNRFGAVRLRVGDALDIQKALVTFGDRGLVGRRRNFTSLLQFAFHRLDGRDALLVDAVVGFDRRALVGRSEELFLEVDGLGDGVDGGARFAQPQIRLAAAKEHLCATRSIRSSDPVVLLERVAAKPFGHGEVLELEGAEGHVRQHREDHALC